MPIYEFKCKNCGEVFEVLVMKEGDSPDKCEKCGGELEKLVSLSSFRLLGSGWFKPSKENDDNE